MRHLSAALLLSICSVGVAADRSGAGTQIQTLQLESAQRASKMANDNRDAATKNYNGAREAEAEAQFLKDSASSLRESGNPGLEGDAQEMEAKAKKKQEEAVAMRKEGDKQTRTAEELEWQAANDMAYAQQNGVTAEQLKQSDAYSEFNKKYEETGRFYDPKTGRAYEVNDPVMYKADYISDGKAMTMEQAVTGEDYKLQPVTFSGEDSTYNPQTGTFSQNYDSSDPFGFTPGNNPETTASVEYFNYSDAYANGPSGGAVSNQIVSDAQLEEVQQSAASGGRNWITSAPAETTSQTTPSSADRTPATAPATQFPNGKEPNVPYSGIPSGSAPAGYQYKTWTQSSCSRFGGCGEKPYYMIVPAG